MIWLIGYKGMLGTDVASALDDLHIEILKSDREIDITNCAVLRDYVESKQIDWIINCAAYTDVDGAEKEKKTAFAINGQGAENIAQIAIEKNARLIHISTDYVFSGETTTDYNEEDRPNPLSVYGASKLDGEARLKRRCSTHFIIRTSWLYGLYGHNFVKTMLNLFRGKKEVRVVHDQWGKPTYTKDLAALIARVIGINSDLYGTYHFSNGGCITWYTFALEILKTAGRLNIINKDVNLVPITSEDFLTSAKRPQYTCMATAKIQKSFDIAIVDWRESLHRYLELTAAA